MAIHDPTPQGRLARRRYAAAFMSDTKWRKLFELVEAQRPDLNWMMVKFIDVPEACRMRFPPSLGCRHAYMHTIEYGPTELRAIEWLEVDADIAEIIAAVGRFPLMFSEGRTRVSGYDDPAGAKGG